MAMTAIWTLSALIRCGVAKSFGAVFSHYGIGPGHAVACLRAIERDLLDRQAGSATPRPAGMALAGSRSSGEPAAVPAPRSPSQSGFGVDARRLGTFSPLVQQNQAAQNSPVGSRPVRPAETVPAVGALRSQPRPAANQNQWEE